MVGDLVDHMSRDHAYEQHYPQLKLIVEKIVSHIPDFEALLAIVKLSHIFKIMHS